MSLPKLLYVGDVPVESSFHGSALLYRLLENYPAAKLRIIEGAGNPSLAQRRLPKVRYERLFIPCKRYLNTRLHSFVSTTLSMTARWRSRQLRSLLEEFSPTALCTVGHGYSWLTAAAYARRYNLPLHLIIHDDWPRAADIIGPARQWLNDQFGQVYRQSVSRMCVSPFMVQNYLTRYGVQGDVLYPSRSANTCGVSELPARVDRGNRAFTVAFGGTINSPGYSQALRELAEALQAQAGQLNIYGPLTQSQAIDIGLARSNVKLCGLLPSEQFINELKNHVDVLFLPMSFAESDRENMSLCFPSKLTDYTVTGVPILIYGPEYCSAVRWALENKSVAEIVSEQDPMALSHGVIKLHDAQYRRQLGKNALEAGNKYFSHETVQNKFFEHLNNSLSI